MTAYRLLPRYTVEDYQRWKGDWELWGGYAIATSPSSFGRHQAIASRLLVMLSNAIEKTGCAAHAIAELDWIVSDDTVVRPDLILICGDVPEKHLSTPPALVAEVLSNATRENDLRFKYELYQSQEVMVYLVIDPSANAVTFHRLVDGQYQSTTHTDFVEVVFCSDCNATIHVSQLFR